MRNILTYKTISIIFVLGIVWFGLSVFEVYRESNQVLRQVNDIEAQIIAAEEENKKLKQLDEYLQSPAYLEKQARLKLNYKILDENVTFVYTSENQGQEEPLVIESMPGYIKWWYYLIGKRL